MVIFQLTIRLNGSKLASWYNRYFGRLWGTRFGIAMLLSAVMLIVIPELASAQTGTVKGEVRDASTGEPIAGAWVSVQSTGQKSQSDSDGRFILRRTPTGIQTLAIVRYGYHVKETTLDIDSGQFVHQNIELVGEQSDGDRIFSIARRKAEARALNSQKESARIKSVMTFDQIDRFADYTVEEAMIRIPGVQAGSHGEINLRGVGYNKYNVNLNGQRMASTGLGDRSVDLGSLSTDMVYDLEVIKVLTPDMDADAMAGTINIRPFRPAGAQRYVDIRMGGQGDPQFFRHTGPGLRASLRYAERLREDVTISAFMFNQLNNRGWESLEVDYGVAEFGSGPVDVIERVSPGFHTDEGSWLGGGLELMYQPSISRTYYLRGLLNRNDRETIRHRNNYIAGGDWISPDSTGSRGTFTYDGRLNDAQIQQYMVQAGAKHYMNAVNLNYNVGWSHGRNRHSDFLIPFSRSGLSFAVGGMNRTRPTMKLTDVLIEPDNIIIQNIDNIVDLHIENKFTGNFNFEFPFSVGSLGLGSSALINRKIGNHKWQNRRYQGLANLNNFDLLKGREVEIFNSQEYQISPMIDIHNTHRTFINLIAQFLESDENSYRFRSDIWNYKANEQQYAGYGMVTLDMGIMRIIGGARVEHAVNEYDGNRAGFNRFGRHLQTTDTTASATNTHLFPHAQLLIAPAMQTKIRLAYSKSMARPDFNILAPFERTNLQTLSLFRGNPSLNPVISNNLDIMLEQYFSGNGRFGLGLFYKELSGLIFERQRTVEIMSGDIMAFDELFDEQTTVVTIDERSYENSDQTTDVYGLELFWQQNLTFLPGFLSNFGIYTNYTWSHSVYRVDYRDDKVRLPYQSPHVVNAMVNYSQGRFFLQTAYHWTAKFVSQLQESPEIAPSIHQGNEVYMDTYQDGWMDLSVSGIFRISNNFRFWADFYNILNVERSLYKHTREFYPVETSVYGGFSFRAGIHYSL